MALLESRVAEEELRSRVKTLRRQLEEAEAALENVSSSTNGGLTSNAESFSSLTTDFPVAGRILSHKGYLFKWQDRSIGWSGTKWALRFVSLARGKISYYRVHTDSEPRYVLTLRGFAVRDDGFKRNNRHKKHAPTPPPMDEVGAYFHVFSIYQRPHKDAHGVKDVSEIIPLLRFSTPSLAEKTKWISLISEACAYCDTLEFLRDEEQAKAEEDFKIAQQAAMAIAMPQAQRGTLPPLYFAPEPAKKSKLQRVPSGVRLPKAAYQTASKETDAEKLESAMKGYPPSKPMHRSNGVSYLSEDAPVQNYRGLFNLAIIVLVISNLRLLLESIRKHGAFWNYLPVKTIQFAQSSDKWHEFPVLTGLVLMQAFIVSAFALELLLSRQYLSNSFGMALHRINANGCLVLISYIVWHYCEIPAGGAFLLFHGVITWMKLVSYLLANEDYRRSSEEAFQSTMALVKDLEPDEENIIYPENVTLWNLYYFWLAPTLTYQIAFPRSPRIRLFKLFVYTFRLFIVLTMFGFLSVQIITPNLKKLTEELEANDGEYSFYVLAEYGLKLCIVNTGLWLLMFYGYFHCYLNLWGEMLRFGDRVFYQDWWNSKDVSSYWRLWNMPVHYWLVRHLYFPALRFGCSKTGATVVVFLVSAIVHELLISVPFHMIRPWTFFGMIMQIPLVMITKGLVKRFPGSSMGNVIFWITFCIVGQPTAILLYTVDFQVRKDAEGESGLWQEVCTRRWWGGIICTNATRGYDEF